MFTRCDDILVVRQKLETQQFKERSTLSLACFRLRRKVIIVIASFLKGRLMFVAKLTKRSFPVCSEDDGGALRSRCPPRPNHRS